MPSSAQREIGRVALAHHVSGFGRLDVAFQTWHSLTRLCTPAAPHVLAEHAVQLPDTTATLCSTATAPGDQTVPSCTLALLVLLLFPARTSAETVTPRVRASVLSKPVARSRNATVAPSETERAAHCGGTVHTLLLPPMSVRPRRRSRSMLALTLAAPPRNTWLPRSAPMMLDPRSFREVPEAATRLSRRTSHCEAFSLDTPQLAHAPVPARNSSGSEADARNGTMRTSTARSVTCPHASVASA
jgi:hypothetical protein